MKPSEIDYYNKFAHDAQQIYGQQVIEYRATGSYTPSENFGPIGNSNVWVRKDHPNPLEKEILSYDTVQFPLRPPEFDHAYEERDIRRIVKRKLKDKGKLKEDDTFESDVDFEAEVEKERNKRRDQLDRT